MSKSKEGNKEQCQICKKYGSDAKYTQIHLRLDNITENDDALNK